MKQLKKKNLGVSSLLLVDKQSRFVAQYSITFRQQISMDHYLMW